MDLFASIILSCGTFLVLAYISACDTKALPLILSATPPLIFNSKLLLINATGSLAAVILGLILCLSSVSTLEEPNFFL